MLWSGADLSGKSPAQRPITTIFQDNNLFPHLTAAQNVGLGVRPDLRLSKGDAARVDEALNRVGLAGLGPRKPAALSGGQIARVALARALLRDKPIMLLDEPFGALDALTRGTIQDELLKIWSGTSQTVFMITHDIDEAILLADRILLMTNGPFARVAESVEITIPRPRKRDQIIDHPNYYAIRNHLVHFLATRSKELAGRQNGSESNTPQTVRIDLLGDAKGEDSDDPRPASHLRAVNE
mgnify:CR=1 FL=1